MCQDVKQSFQQSSFKKAVLGVPGVHVSEKLVFLVTQTLVRNADNSDKLCIWRIYRMSETSIVEERAGQECSVERQECPVERQD